jgi:alkylation response protein AidB-like acyl-CoA dehydrogenase
MTSATAELTTAESVRSAVRAFIDEQFDRDISLRTWLERLADSGWGVPTLPANAFGKGLTPDLAAVAFDEFRKVKAVGPPAGLGRMLAAPTIIAHGSDEVKQQFVRRILTGEDAWCQLFSEPGAGSDLASLQTRAELDGDEYVVNGQKVWTSGARGADLGMLLARTDVDVPKHRGITYFAFEMDQPGVEVRPLKQITGDAQFAEVFFTDARVPAANIIGELNGGWGVAMTTLMNERVGLGAGAGLGFPLTAPAGRKIGEQFEVSLGEFIDKQSSNRTLVGSAGRNMGLGQLLDYAKKNGRDKDPAVRQQIARAYTLTQLLMWNGLRAKEGAKAGKLGPEASLGKLMMSHVTRQNRETALSIVAGESMLAGKDGPLGGSVATQVLFTPAPSIYGGSDQIQRNIISERVLGLPKDPDISRDVPFRDLKVGTQSKAN